MTDGFHAADDGSLARSTGGAAARGALLIALAIVIGLVLIAFALNDSSTEVAASDDTEQTDTDETGDAADSSADTDADADAGAEVEAVDPGDGAGDADGAAADGGDTETIPEEPINSGGGAARPAAEVNVLVANGVGTAGIAGSTADVLVADGYIGVAADAPNTPTSVIFYQPGFDADAREVATILGATPDVIQPLPVDGSVPVNQNAIDDGRAAAANVVVIIGTDGAIPTP